MLKREQTPQSRTGIFGINKESVEINRGEWSTVFLEAIALLGIEAFGFPLAFELWNLTFDPAFLIQM